MFKIIKKGSNNFWHVFNNGAKNVSISDFEVVLDDVLNTFVIVLRNGANIPQIALSVLDIIVIDETGSGVEETYLTASQLRARLVVLGYTAYLGAGNADSITGLIDAGTNVTITGSGTLADPYIINSSGGSGTTPTLNQVLAENNQTAGENILINDADAIELENGSLLKKGSYDFGGDGGISRICSVGYEDMWQSGIRHVFDNNGFIRNSTNCFNIVPDSSFDNTLRFKVGSIWTLDNGTSYVCTDDTTGSAVWDLVNINTPTLQQVTTEGNETTDEVIFRANANVFVKIDSTTGFIEFWDLSIDAVNPISIINQGYIKISDGSTNKIEYNPYGNILSIENNLFGYIINPQGNEVLDKTTTKSLFVQVPTSITDTRVQTYQDASGTIALISDIPTTATDLDALKRDGSNANADVDLSDYNIIAKKIKTFRPGTDGGMTLSSNNLTAEHTAEWQDKDYTGIADITDIPDVSNLVVKNTAITGATKTKITYDAKGLVTSGADATTADIADSTNKRYQTDNQNSFNDATSSIQTQLNAKQATLSYTPYKFVQTSQTAHTGTTAETIVATATINGGTLPSTEILKVLFGINKTGLLGVYTIRLRINTTNSLSGSTTIATFNAGGATNQLILMSRSFSLLGGNLSGYPFTTSAVTDIVNVGGTLSSTTYNTANTLYFFFTVQLVNATDSITPNLANLTN
jgi:hypothetical protein